MVRKESMKKIYAWVIGLLIALILLSAFLITSSVDAKASEHKLVEANLKIIDLTKIGKCKVDLPSLKNIQFKGLNRFIARCKIFLVKKLADNVTGNDTNVSPKQPLTYMEDVDVKGKATRVYVTEYFRNLPPVMRRILQLMIGSPGKVLCFGYVVDTPNPSYHRGKFYPSKGWVLIDNEKNITGRFYGDLTFIKPGNIGYCVGIEGFEGKIVKIKPNEYGSYEVYFEGHAKRVCIKRC